MEVTDYLRRKAEQCRRLAAEFSNQNDPAAKNLIAFGSKGAKATPEIGGSE